MKALSEKTKMIRLPLNRANQLIQIEKLRKENDQFESTELTNDEIANALAIEEASVNDIVNASRDYVSIDQPIMYDKKERHLSEILPDGNFKEPEDEIIDYSLREYLHSSLGSLTDKEKQVLIMRYGLGGAEPMSLKEIGKRFNLTKERIRQIEKKAIRRLRHPARSHPLSTFLKS